MTRAQTNLLGAQAALYEDERQFLLGVPLPDRAEAGIRGAGMLRSLGQGFAHDGLGYARDQWYSLVDHMADVDQEILTPERYEELVNDPIVGRLDVPYEAGLTVRQFRNRMRRHLANQYMEQFDRSLAGHATRFVGAMGGGMFAPEILATLPIGGPAAQSAIRAKTTADFLRLSTISSAQISAAATPLNLFAQQQVYGEIDPLEVALTATAPFLFVPATTGLTRLLSSAEQRGLAAAAGTTEPPPAVREPLDTHIPVDFRAEFDQFPGGLERWAEDFARGTPESEQFLRQLGATDDGLRELRQRVFVESSRTPLTAEQILDIDAVEGFISNVGLSPEKLARIERAGLLDAARLAKDAVGRAPADIAPDQAAARALLQQRRRQVEAQFPEVRAALAYRDFVRAGGDPRATQTGPVPGAAGVPRAQPSDAIRAQAATLQRAVETNDPTLVPEPLRDLVRRIIRAQEFDAAARRAGFPDETAILEMATRAARGDVAAQQSFNMRIMHNLPEYAEGDWRALRTHGIEGVRARYVDRQIDRANSLTARLGAMDEARARGQDVADYDQTRADLVAQLQETQRLIDAVQTQPSRPPAEINVDDVAGALAASRLKRGEASPIEAPARQHGSHPSTQRPVSARDELMAEADSLRAEIVELQKFARQHGVDIDQLDPGDGVRQRFDAAMRAIRECQI